MNVYLKSSVCLLIYFLLTLGWLLVATTVKAQTPTIYLPYDSENITFPQMVVQWFGAVSPQSNYADIRLGFSDSLFRIDVSVVDQWLYYQPKPTPDTLAGYDAITIFFETTSHQRYQLIRQVNWWEADTNYQAAAQYSNGEWQALTNFFSSSSGWRGNAFNDQIGDRGWTASLKVPFSATLPKPREGERWKMMLLLHDRDGNLNYTTTAWPSGAQEDNSTTWSTLVFSTLPDPVVRAQNQQSLILTQSANYSVPDGEVGGHTTCGSGLDFWTQWGDKNYQGQKQINIQNQSDIADWPCFSKYYLSFALSQIPPGKVITKATLILHQFGNAGGGAYADATPSLIHPYLVSADFNESALNWNNAPLALLNSPPTLVSPMTQPLVWPGVPWNFDVTRLIQHAYAQNQKANLALYSSDGDYHSGKYFSSSDVDDWNYKARPRLEITYGDPENTTPTPDYNQNGKIELFDWNILLKNIFTPSCVFDLNSDCFTDYLDIRSFVGWFK